MEVVLSVDKPTAIQEYHQSTRASSQAVSSVARKEAEFSPTFLAEVSRQLWAISRYHLIMLLRRPLEPCKKTITTISASR